MLLINCIEYSDSMSADKLVIGIKFNLNIILSTIIESSIDGIIWGKFTVDVLDEGYSLFRKFGLLCKFDCLRHGGIVGDIIDIYDVEVFVFLGEDAL
jgi:hypothetical protein